MPETYEVPLIFGGCFPHPSAFWGHETNSKFEAQMGENKPDIYGDVSK